MIILAKAFLKRYKELILYGIFGVGATLVNIIFFYIFTNIAHIPFLLSNTFAWIAAFIFAFTTNKLFVFESYSWKGKTALREMWNFFLARLLTGIMDMLFMWAFNEWSQINGMVSKIIVNILVIIVNYVASKFWIFKTNNS